MSSLLPSLVILGGVAAAALFLARERSSPVDLVEERVAAATALGLAIAAQGAHFAEEWATGFHIRFPALFGLPPMPLSFFVTFNLAWLVIWIVSVPFVRSARRPAFFAAWFLAIAAMMNGAAHPALAIASEGYFPGLITSPAIGLAGLWLWVRLRRATTESRNAA